MIFYVWCRFLWVQASVKRAVIIKESMPILDTRTDYVGYNIGDAIIKKKTTPTRDRKLNWLFIRRKKILNIISITEGQVHI